jgi:hypothetical protein
MEKSNSGESKISRQRVASCGADRAGKLYYLSSPAERIKTLAKLRT